LEAKSTKELGIDSFRKELFAVRCSNLEINAFGNSFIAYKSKQLYFVLIYKKILFFSVLLLFVNNFYIFATTLKPKKHEKINFFENHC
jgi:hypothetical protein